MGISTTAVYDIERFRTIVLRNCKGGIEARNDALDTLASFSRHCEELRGVAKSTTEVSAQWGGPPYVTYDVAANRFRIIVIWNESSDDTSRDVPFLVAHALDRLKRAVCSVTEPLLRNEPSAVATLYNEAFYALTPDTPIILPHSSDPPQPRSKFSFSLSTPRASTASSDVSKKSSLLGKISSAFKPKESKKTEEISHVSASSGGPFGNQDRLDDKEGPLVLPDSLFIWCPSTTSPLSVAVEDVSWLSALVLGEEVPPSKDISASPLASSNPTPSGQIDLPALRSGSSLSTPLTVPQVASTPTATIKSELNSSPLPMKADSLEPVVNPLNSDRLQSHDVQPHVLDSPDNPSATSVLHEKQTLSNQSTEKPVDPVFVPTDPTSISAGLGIPDASSRAVPLTQAAPLDSAQIVTSIPLQGSHEQPQLPENIQQQQAHFRYQQQMMLQRQMMAAVSSPQQLQTPQQQLQAQDVTLSDEPHSHNYSNLDPGAQVPTSEKTALLNDRNGDSEFNPAQSKPADDFDLNQLGDYKDAATEVSNLMSGSGSGSGPGSSASENVKKATDDAIRNRMNEFALTMQSGNFSLALEQVYNTLRFLCQIQPRRERETVTCANYVLAQKILMRNATLEGELTRLPPMLPDALHRKVECALLTMFLAELKHFLPRHRVAAMRVAVEKNMAVGNFGMCARWLRQLIEKAPPTQREVLTRQLQLCVAQGEVNAHMPPTNRLCYATLHVVTSPYGKCDFCTAVYHPTMSGVMNGQSCGTCFVGQIHAST